MSLARFIAACFGLAAPAAATAAACDPLLELSPSAVQLSGYNPLSGGGAEQALSVTITNRGAVCTLTAAVKSPTGGVLLDGPGSERLSAALLSGTDGTAIEPARRGADATPQSRLGVFVLRPEETVTIPLRLIVPASQLVGPGMYRTKLDFEVSAPLEPRVREFVTLPVDFGVVGAAQIGLAGALDGVAPRAMSAPVIPLGDLTDGLQIDLPVQLSVVATSAYVMRFSSANLGRLAQVNSGADAGRPQAFISYTLWVDGAAAPLGSAEGELRRRRPIGERATEILPLRVQVGETAGRPAGLYRDTVVIEVLPRS